MAIPTSCQGLGTEHYRQNWEVWLASPLQEGSGRWSVHPTQTSLWSPQRQTHTWNKHLMFQWRDKNKLGGFSFENIYVYAEIRDTVSINVFELNRRNRDVSSILTGIKHVQKFYNTCFYTKPFWIHCICHYIVIKTCGLSCYSLPKNCSRKESKKIGSRNL